jgi:hypothetical protein
MEVKELCETCVGRIKQKTGAQVFLCACFGSFLLVSQSISDRQP